MVSSARKRSLLRRSRSYWSPPCAGAAQSSARSTVQPCWCNSLAGPSRWLTAAFEGGQFSGFILPLPIDAKDLSGWNISSSDPNNKLPNPLAWIKNDNSPGSNVGVVTPFGSEFIDLSGAFDRQPFPRVTQDLSLEPGPYLLQFALV